MQHLWYWIPACARMTEEVPEELLPKVWECLRITGKLRFARATHRGRAEGQSPFAEGLGVSPISLIIPHE